MRRTLLVLTITLLLILTLIQYNYTIQSIIKLEDNFKTINTNYWQINQENSVISVIQDSRCVDNYCLLINSLDGTVVLNTNYMRGAYLSNLLIRYIDITPNQNTKLLCINMTNTYICLRLNYESSTVGTNTYVTTTLLLDVAGTTYPLVSTTYVVTTPYTYLLSTYSSFKDVNITITFYENEVSTFLTYVDANLMSGTVSRTTSITKELCTNISILGEYVMYMIDYVVVNGYLIPKEEVVTPTIPIPTTPPKTPTNTTTNTTTPTTTPTTYVENRMFILLLILITLSIIVMSKKKVILR